MRADYRHPITPLYYHGVYEGDAPFRSQAKHCGFGSWVCNARKHKGQVGCSNPAPLEFTAEKAIADLIYQLGEERRARNIEL